jgi:hypothetical protein
VNFKILKALIVFIVCGVYDAHGSQIKMINDAKVVISKSLLNRLVGKSTRNAVLFKERVSVIIDGTSVGYLIGGQGLRVIDGRENSVCFVALVKNNKVRDVVWTVGNDNWEAETCLSINEIGAIDAHDKNGVFRIGLLYDAASPNASVTEPVVISLSRDAHLRIDQESSEKASLAGATKLDAVIKAVAP